LRHFGITAAKSYRAEVLCYRAEVVAIVCKKWLRAIERFLSTVSERDELLTDFDECLWLTVVDSVLVQRDGTLTFRFVDGTEIVG